MVCEPRSILESLRNEIKLCLPPRAFLKTDRGDALFISNAPRFMPDAIPSIDGFDICISNDLARIEPSPARIRTMENEIRTIGDDLALSLKRFRGQAVDRATIRLFNTILKSSDQRFDALERTLRQRSALALRHAAQGGGLLLCACLIYNGKQNSIIQEEKT